MKSLRFWGLLNLLKLQFFFGEINMRERISFWKQVFICHKNTNSKFVVLKDWQVESFDVYFKYIQMNWNKTTLSFQRNCQINGKINGNLHIELFRSLNNDLMIRMIELLFLSELERETTKNEWIFILIEEITKDNVKLGPEISYVTFNFCL